MTDPKHATAAPRANDRLDAEPEEARSASSWGKPVKVSASDADEMSAESAPELRDIPMKGGVDRAQARR